MALSSSMLFAWSLSVFIVPSLGAVLTALYGAYAFMYAAIAIRAIFTVRLMAAAYESWGPGG